jgi:hypothetical protein
MAQDIGGLHGNSQRTGKYIRSRFGGRDCRSRQRRIPDYRDDNLRRRILRVSAIVDRATSDRH